MNVHIRLLPTPFYILGGPCHAFRITRTEDTLTKELPIILQKYSYISIEVIFYSSVFHVPSLLQGKQKHLDCLLFFGKTTMEYTPSKITPTIP